MSGPRQRPGLRPAAPGGARGAIERVRLPREAYRGPPGHRSIAWRDAQAGVPSAGWPRAQLAFKDSVVRGILQFTPGIAFRYVLHRCESRDIRCRESCGVRLPSAVVPPALPAPDWGWASVEAPPLRRSTDPWRPPRRVWSARHPPHRTSPPRPIGRASGPRGECGGWSWARATQRVGRAFPLRRSTFTSSQVFLIRVSAMILPQVHLRKPCYDFSFL